MKKQELFVLAAACGISPSSKESASQLARRILSCYPKKNNTRAAAQEESSRVGEESQVEAAARVEDAGETPFRPEEESTPRNKSAAEASESSEDMDFEPGPEDNGHEGHKHTRAPTRVRDNNDATPATAKKFKNGGGFPLRNSESEYEPYGIDDSSAPEFVTSNDEEESAHFTSEESATATDDSISGRHRYARGGVASRLRVEEQEEFRRLAEIPRDPRLRNPKRKRSPHKAVSWGESARRLNVPKITAKEAFESSASDGMPSPPKARERDASLPFEIPLVFRNDPVEWGGRTRQAAKFAAAESVPVGGAQRLDSALFGLQRDFDSTRGGPSTAAVL